MEIRFKSFEEMTPADYESLGLKSGLEIHQQLLTEKKLFCHCPAGLYDKNFDAEILRHMRPTLSELGEYDGTALMEFKTKKEIIYRINHQSVCTYEMDDTPPFEINDQALDIALQIGLLMNFKMVDEIHIARKQYLDGSIPTGFQRTTIVGVDGWIPYKDRKIGLIQLGLEEDSCREISDIKHERVYITDRLGMPLIETVTQPQMRTPQEVAEVADILRKLVRLTGKVRTGLGAARQDVNVSIAGGTRIEIKGVPRIPLIPRLIYNEARRQYSLLAIREELHKRGITADSFQFNTAEVTRFLRNTNWAPLRQAVDRGEVVYCVNLKGFLGILSASVQTGKVFSKEISDRVRVIACLSDLPNILTSESTEETIDSHTGIRIRKAVQAGSNDSMILVWGNETDVKTAIQEIVIRAREATMGIPSETRQALADGTTGFERILPGPERMYPDTDLPPIAITEEKLEQLQTQLPQPQWERVAWLRKRGVPVHLWEPMALHEQYDMFARLFNQFSDLPGTLMARLLYDIPLHLKRKGLNTKILSEDVYKELLTAIEKRPVLAEAALDLMQLLCKGNSSLKTLLQRYTTASITLEKIQARLDGHYAKSIPHKLPPETFVHLLMEKIRVDFLGVIPGVDVHQMVWQYVNSKLENSHE